jgi:hypothetical protein
MRNQRHFLILIKTSVERIKIDLKINLTKLEILITLTCLSKANEENYVILSKYIRYLCRVWK